MKGKEEAGLAGTGHGCGSGGGLTTEAIPVVAKSRVVWTAVDSRVGPAAMESI